MFSEKNAISLSENEGGWGSKAVWKLSENLSNLVAWPVPKWALNSLVSRAFGNFFLKTSFIVSAMYPYQSGAAQPTCSSRLSFQPRVLISFWQLGLPSIFQSIILSIQQGFHRHLILINLRMKKIWTFTGTCMWRKLCTLNRHVSQTNFKTCKCTGDHPEQPGRKGFWMGALPTRGVMSRFLIATVRCFRSPSTPPLPPPIICFYWTLCTISNALYGNHLF